MPVFGLILLNVNSITKTFVIFTFLLLFLYENIHTYMLLWHFIIYILYDIKL